MKGLSKNWLTEPSIDFEYKKYTLLGYLQHVQQQLTTNKLYPYYPELLRHHRALTTFWNNKDLLRHQFPRSLSGLDVSTLSLLYQELEEDMALLDELNAIVAFSLPEIEKTIDEAAQLEGLLKEHLHFTSVGIMPLHQTEGYLLLKQQKNIGVYAYQLSMIQAIETPQQHVYTQFITTYNSSITTTLEHIKTDLINQRKTMPNPATYAVETSVLLPLNETLLPLATQVLYEYVVGHE